MRKSEKKDKENVMVVSDESRLRVITRPKGGRRSLCMDLEEVKACRDTLSSFSNSTLDTSSGVTSPICCISSPGDDPKDVKARLKLWAQAVAASASRYGT
ncbi:hypothetical protein D0Y65_002595 [Glycine soja]|nr:hypothetical protein glysoja_022855 [Glycine soja]RZC22804.1 hypothetical protein D0Y65_002595 [Glycine soja]